jgi:DnaK suppressor protein
VAAQDNTRYVEQEPLSDEQLEHLKAVLLHRKERILTGEEEQIEAAKNEDALRMSDEVDLASAEYDQAFEYRIRDRERKLLKKVDKALTRMEEGGYDECESCGNFIGFKRLSARPEASLCIECKEEQERVEKNYRKHRDVDRTDPFK